MSNIESISVTPEEQSTYHTVKHQTSSTSSTVPEQQRAQPWKTFWRPAAVPEKVLDVRSEKIFEKGETVIVSDSGQVTAGAYSKLYKANAVPNTTEVKKDVHIEKDASGQCFAKFE